MTIGNQSYGYTSYPSTNYLNQTQQSNANTSIHSNSTVQKKSVNKGAVAVGLATTAGLALTALAASKGKKITGQEKLTANLKAGFNEIKDDCVKYGKKAIDYCKEGFEKIKNKFNGNSQNGIVNEAVDDLGVKHITTKDGYQITEWNGGFHIKNMDDTMEKIYTYGNQFLALPPAKTVDVAEEAAKTAFKAAKA